MIMIRPTLTIYQAPLPLKIARKVTMRQMSLSLSGHRDRQRPPDGSSGLRRRRSKIVTGFVLTIVVGALPALAAAEGAWNSSLDSVRSGFTSRSRTDRNSDGAATTAQISGCSRSDGADFGLDIELRRRRTLAPDVSYGRRNVDNCTTGSPTANWGRAGSGEHFLQFWHYNFGTVSARSVNVGY